MSKKEFTIIDQVVYYNDWGRIQPGPGKDVYEARKINFNGLH
jgi:hypothetical protein